VDAGVEVGDVVGERRAERPPRRGPVVEPLGVGGPPDAGRVRRRAAAGAAAGLWAPAGLRARAGLRVVAGLRTGAGLCIW
jgi:hypothetical protein